MPKKSASSAKTQKSFEETLWDTDNKLLDLIDCRENKAYPLP